MRYLSFAFLLFIFLQVNAQKPSVTKDYVENQIIVKLKQGLKNNTKASIMQGVNANTKHRFKTFDAELWEIPNRQENLEIIINKLQENPAIEYAELNYITKISDIPNDEHFEKLWGLRNTQQFGGKYDADIDMDQAWNITLGCSSVVVGIIDTGIDYNHEDIQNSMWVNPNEIPNNGIDDDNNDYVDDYYGYDFVNDDGDPMDDHYHGTHCAGIIAAEYNNEIGISGIAPNVHIMALKAFDSQGYSTTVREIEAIEYATLMNVQLTNNSWGSVSYSQSLKDAIEVNGRPFVASAGNNSNNNDNISYYPSGYDLPNIISVAATDKNDNLASFSNYGSSTVDIAAPGVYIYSCKPNDGYVYKDGTSMAAPHVSGVVALMLSINLLLSPENIRQRIIQNSDYISNLQGKCVANGRLNAYKVLPYISDPTTVCTSNSTFTLNNCPSGTTVSWTKSSNLNYVSGQGTDNYTVKAASSTTSGSGWVQTVISGTGCGDVTVREDFWVGIPYKPYTRYPDPEICAYQFVTEDYVMPATPGASTYSLTENSPYLMLDSCFFNFPPVINFMASRVGNYQVQVEAENQCGVSQYSSTIYVSAVDCGGGFSLLSISPNPANDYVEAEIQDDNFEPGNNNKIHVKLFNNRSVPVYTGNSHQKTFRINTGNLPHGLYLLQVIYKGEKYSKQVLIEH